MARAFPQPCESAGNEKWRFVKARPEPDLRYFSNFAACSCVGNSIETTIVQGLNLLV